MISSSLLTRDQFEPISSRTMVFEELPHARAVSCSSLPTSELLYHGIFSNSNRRQCFTEDRPLILAASTATVPITASGSRFQQCLRVQRPLQSFGKKYFTTFILIIFSFFFLPFSKHYLNSSDNAIPEWNAVILFGTGPLFNASDDNERWCWRGSSWSKRRSVPRVRCKLLNKCNQT
jgi:hypothetical protein